MPVAIHPAARLPAEWREAMAALGQPAYRAEQVFRWIHRQGVMVPAEMTNLPKGLRTTLTEQGLAPPLEVVDGHRSQDGAHKLVARAHDGARVETVLLPEGSPTADFDADLAAAGEADEEEVALTGEPGDQPTRPLRRISLCISSQVGCAMGCVVCASGRAGLVRHLGPEEVVGQVIAARITLKANEGLHNVLFMGMGEPLHNYDATSRAVRLMTHPEGLGLSPRRITISTCGLPRGIDRLAADFEGRVGLAVSVHGADDETRSRLCPVGKRYPLAELARAVRSYAATARRPVTVEYTLVEGCNDDVRHATALARLLSSAAVKINLIPLNPIPSSPLAPPAPERVAEFQRRLVAAGLRCFVRRRRGDDVSAACGQLALCPSDPADSTRGKTAP